MGWLDILSPDTWLGSDDEPKTIQSSRYTPEQEDLLRRLINRYSSYIDQPTEKYAGERVAPLSSLETDAIGNLSGYTPFLQNLSADARVAFSDIMSGKTSTPKYLEDQYVTGVEKPMIETWKRDILPEITGGMNKRGLLYGSDRENMEMRSAETLADALSLGRSDLSARLEQIGKENQFNAFNALNTAGGSSLSEILGLTTAKSGLGATERGVEQAGLDTEYEEWLRGQPGSRPQDMLLLSILGLQPYDTAVQGASPGLLPGLMSAVATYYGGNRGKSS